MNKHHRILSAGILLSVAAGSALARTRVALPDFSSDDNSCRSLIAGAQVAAAIQIQISDIADVEWVERAEINTLIAEANLARSALAAADTIRVGRMLKANIVIRGQFITVQKERQLCMEAIDLFRAEVLASRTIPCPGDNMNPVEVSTDWLQTASAAAREVVTEGLSNLQKTSKQKTIGGLFIRNLSPNSRLNFLNSEILTRLEGAINQNADLRWLKFSRTDESIAESQLSVLGLTSPDPATWRAPADLFLWGSVEEQRGYTGPAEKVPFTITLETWNGAENLQKVTCATTLSDWPGDIDKAAQQLMAIARTAQPTVTPGVRAAISQKLLSRDATGPYGTALYELARFFSPDDVAIQKKALERRSSQSPESLRAYTHHLTMLQELATHIDQYPQLTSAGKIDDTLWRRYMYHLKYALEIEQERRTAYGLPYDFNRDVQQKTDEQLIALTRKVIAKIEPLRERDPKHSMFQSDYFHSQLLNGILASRASIDARIQLAEAYWPWVAPYYKREASSGGSLADSIRANLLAVYESAGQSQRANAILSGQIADAKPRVITVNVPRIPAPPTNAPVEKTVHREMPASRMPPEVQARMVELERIRRGANAQTPRAVEEPLGPVKNVPLVAISYEMYDEVFSDPNYKSLNNLSTTDNTQPYRSGSVIPLAMTDDVIWISQNNDSKTLTAFQPALAKPLGTFSDKHIVDVAKCGNILFGASSTNGLIILSDGTPSPARTLGGAEGLATSNLDAITANDQYVFLSGHDTTGKSRIIRYEPKSRKFEDLLTGLPQNNRLWLHGNTLVYGDTNGIMAMDLTSGTKYALGDALVAAGWSPPTPMSIRNLKYIGKNTQGYFFSHRDQILGLSENRAKLLPAISFNGARIETCELAPDGKHLFVIANAESSANREKSLAASCSYLVVIDLTQSKMLAQYRLPGRRPSRMLCAANRIWIGGGMNDPLIAVNCSDLKIPQGQKLATPADATPQIRLAYAAFNGDNETIRSVLSQNRAALTDYIANNQHNAYACAFRTASFDTLKILMGEGSTALTPPENAPVIAAMRNMPELITLSSASSINLNDSPYFSLERPIFLAIACGNQQALEALIEAGADMNAKSKSAETPLMLAANYSAASIVEKILDAKPEIDARNNDGMTALHFAVSRNDPRIVKLLLDHQANPNLFTKQSFSSDRTMSPLMLAVKNGNREIAAMLLAKGAKINETSPQGQSALTIAQEKNNQAMLELLQNSGAVSASVSAENMRPALSAAISSRNLAELKRLLDAGADPNVADASGVYPIAEAGDHGSMEQIAELLRHGAKQNQLTTPESKRSRELVNESVCKRIAIAQGQLAGVATTQFSVPEIAGATSLPLIEAIEAGDTASALAAINRNQIPQIPKEQWPLLHRAAARHMKEVVALLLNLKNNPDLRDQNGMTPLMIAAAGNDAEMVQLLLTHGAQIHLQNKDGKNAVELARMHGNETVLKILVDPRRAQNRAVVEAASQHYDNTLKLLLDAGLPINGADINGETPLMAAARGRTTDCAAVLLERKADVNQKDLMDRTALHWAVLTEEPYARAEIIRMLIKAGANPDLADKNGVSARQYAERLRIPPEELKAQ